MIIIHVLYTAVHEVSHVGLHSDVLLVISIYYITIL